MAKKAIGSVCSQAGRWWDNKVNAKSRQELYKQTHCGNKGNWGVRERCFQLPVFSQVIDWGSEWGFLKLMEKGELDHPFQASVATFLACSASMNGV